MEQMGRTALSSPLQVFHTGKVDDIDERLSPYTVTHLASAGRSAEAEGAPERDGDEAVFEVGSSSSGLADVVDVAQKLGNVGSLTDLPFASDETEHPLDSPSEGYFAEVIDLAEYQRTRASR